MSKITFSGLLFLVLAGCGSSLVGDIASGVPIYWKVIEGILGQFPELNAWLLLILPLLLTILRLVGAILEKIADKTETTWDNKILKVINVLVKFLSKIVDWMSYGKRSPK